MKIDVFVHSNALSVLFPESKKIEIDNHFVLSGAFWCYYLTLKAYENRHLF
mgnify:CR=1 FL=1